MWFKILHTSSKRLRIQTSITCTLDVQDYMMRSAGECDAIQHIHFYKDLHVFAVMVNEGRQKEVIAFLRQLKVETIRKCYEQPTLTSAETPYDVVTSAVAKRWLFQTLVPYPVRVLLTSYKAIYYAKEALLSFSRGQLTMDTLDGTAIAISVLTKQFDMASSIMFLLELGERLGAWSQKQSFSDLEKSLVSAVESVWVVGVDGPVKTPVKDLKTQDVVLVAEGQEILFDGQVVSGKGSVNESSLTGEFFPVVKEEGDLVYANTVLERGELHIAITNVQSNARVSQLLTIMKETDAQRDTKHYQFIKAADKLVKFNFIGALVTYLLTRSFSKAISFLLVDYSCSLKLSTPVVYLTAIQELIQQGVVVKSTAALDTFQAADVVIFDKTGTITESKPLIHEIIPFDGYTTEEVLRIGACLEEHIYHPIAQAVVDKAEEEGIHHPEMHAELYHIASRGVLSTIDNETVVIGNRLLMAEHDIHLSMEQEELVKELEETYNLLYLGYKGKLIAIFCISLSIRSEALDCLLALKQQGRRVVLLTGDTQKRTDDLVAHLPFDEVVTEMTPLSKHAYVLEQQAAGRVVVMLGDGLNDSAALAASDVSISMGEGADLTKQVSDIVLSSGQLSSLLTIGTMAEQIEKQVQQNVFISISVNTSLITLGLFGLLSGNTLALFHNLTTFGIILTSFKKHQPELLRSQRISLS